MIVNFWNAYFEMLPMYHAAEANPFLCRRPAAANVPKEAFSLRPNVGRRRAQKSSIRER